MAYGSGYWRHGPRYWPAPPGYGHLRASDADRERVTEVLKASFAEGRLTKEEFAERQGRALVARTYQDLGAQLADLPVAPPGSFGPPSRYSPFGMYHPAAMYRPAGSLWPNGGLARPYRASQRINPLAAAALISAFVPFFGSVAAIMLGHTALREIRETGEGGAAVAAAGIALGYVVIALFVLFALVAVIASAHSTGSLSGPPG